MTLNQQLKPGSATKFLMFHTHILKKSKKLVAREIEHNLRETHFHREEDKQNIHQNKRENTQKLQKKSHSKNVIIPRKQEQGFANPLTETISLAPEPGTICSLLEIGYKK